jgi:protein-disulfide isomerase
VYGLEARTDPYSDFVPAPRQARILRDPSKPTIQMAQNRKTATGRNGKVVTSARSSKKSFYIGLAVAAVVGIAALSYITGQASGNRIITLDPNLPPIASQGYVLGSPTAPIELIEFGDFECIVCAKFGELEEPEIREKYVNTGKVRFRFIDYPLNIHRNTVNASNAAACADEQGKFWEMHDLLFSTQHEWNGQATSDPDTRLKALGRRISGLDVARFDDCVASRRMLPKVQSHLKIATDRGIGSTPTFILGTKQFNFVTSGQLSKILDDELAAVAAAAPAKKP